MNDEEDGESMGFNDSRQNNRINNLFLGSAL